MVSIHKATITLEGKVWSGKQVSAIYKYISIYVGMRYIHHNSYEPLWAGLPAQKEVYHVLHPARTYHRRHRVFSAECPRRCALLWHRRTFCAGRISTRQTALMLYGCIAPSYPSSYNTPPRRPPTRRGRNHDEG